MSTTAQKLLDLKEEIEAAKEEKMKAEGALGQLHLQLKSEFNCEDEKEAKQKLEKIQMQLKKLEREIENGITELERNYGKSKS